MNTKLTLQTELSKVLQCSPAERARTIIDSPYTKQILKQLSSQETYMIIKESWGTDSQILLPYIPPETIGHFIDMDCWEKDNLSVEGLFEWLWEIYNASVDTLQDALEHMDLDLVILLFQSYLEVVQVVPTDEHIPDLLNAGYESFDDIYYFRFTEDDEKTQLLKDMLSILFTHHQDIYYGIMEGVLWEIKSFMEESLFERRTLRLMEMGFPPPDEAVSIYQHIRPHSLLKTGLQKEKTPLIDEEKSFLPSLYMEHFSQNKGIVVQAIADSPEETRDRLVYEMIYLANKIIMADFRPLNELDELRKSMDKASSITSLGLAIAMRENKSSAQSILENVNAETLFSLGYNMVYEQQKRLKLLLRELESSMIPESLNEYVEGLLKKRPLYKDTEFSTIEQLEQVTWHIDRIEALVNIAAELAWDRQIDKLKETNTGTNLDMENIVLTSLAVNFIEKQSFFRPVSLTELLDFLEQTTRLDSTGARVFLPEVRDDLIGYLSTFASTREESLIEALADLLVSRFDSELSGISTLTDLDVRFITCFVVRMQE
ncbi:MAG TPA: DUF6178 family protein [Deltaproteobacteria bacterium]|nr:DUF6178 family protein [Deltaproteobacteria bacterium]